MDYRETAEMIFSKHPTRFKKSEKQPFISDIKGVFRDLGYSEGEIRVLHHKGGIKSSNILVGKPDAKYIFTAHYDTPGRTGFMLGSSKYVGQTLANLVLMLIFFIPMFGVGVLLGMDIALAALGEEVGNFLSSFGSLIAVFLVLALISIPMAVKNKNNRNDNTSGVLSLISLARKISANPALRSNCAFIFFDNEEWGLIGSAQYVKWAKGNNYNINNSAIINIDCVGVGEQLVLAQTKKTEITKLLKEGLTSRGTPVKEKVSMMVYMSDHANFKNSVMLCYMDKSSLGPLYIPNIHTKKDTECDLEKIERLTDNLLAVIVN
ncbi:MAG: M28 family peptidase [Oscillospiraceae bacterium]|jgi:hypothetical protein|nr:M28 family peptidase [Oscillospiraceae bacterium]